MLLGDFNYELPAELIAQEPLADRSASRMLVVDRGTSTFTDNSFVDLPAFLREGDLLVLNDTRVFPARLLGRTATGASVEIFLTERKSDAVWEALAKPARRLRAGKQIVFSETLSATFLDRTDEGRVLIEFVSNRDIEAQIDLAGRTPLPPYIKRDPDAIDRDRERYQTVFARERGAIAAPTAGLHFTPQILDQVREQGVRVAHITLHVGYGTFEPVRVSDLADHTVAAERYEISAGSAAELTTARERGGRIVAVGTTTTRALEHCMSTFGEIRAGRYSADLTIRPGFKFRAIDALLTNFHLPESSLLVLTSTFGGHELIMKAYRHAVTERYRFYSYGDCMLIV